MQILQVSCFQQRIVEEEELARKRLGDRFAKARSLLGLTKGQAAKPCGLLPRDIAQIEDGTKRFIPSPYLHFLAKRIDLNSLFDEGMQVAYRAESSEMDFAHNPVIDQLTSAAKQWQAIAGPPEWLKEMIDNQERIKERLAQLEAAQKGATSGKDKKAG